MNRKNQCQMLGESSIILSNEDVLAAMKSIPGYIDITSENVHDFGYMHVIVPAGSGALIILIVALLVNNISRNRRYPEYWL